MREDAEPAPKLEGIAHQVVGMASRTLTAIAVGVALMLPTLFTLIEKSDWLSAGFVLVFILVFLALSVPVVPWETTPSLTWLHLAHQKAVHDRDY
ncbi:hypothetical protein [Rhodococcoides kroppenstedtii]|uniref:hypothetical protein n=1 Tax=Rhodococcoides kroppenstedtii TaxID=293050 RepID=UPI003639F6D1